MTKLTSNSPASAWPFPNRKAAPTVKPAEPKLKLITDNYVKVLRNGKSFNGGSFTWDLPKLNADGTWTPGKVHTLNVSPVLCVRGFHLTNNYQAWFKPGCRVYKTAHSLNGAKRAEDDKAAFRSVQLLEELPLTRKLSLHADFLEDVALHYKKGSPKYQLKALHIREGEIDELSSSYEVNFVRAKIHSGEPNASRKFSSVYHGLLIKLSVLEMNLLYIGREGPAISGASTTAEPCANYGLSSLISALIDSNIPDSHPLRTLCNAVVQACTRGMIVTNVNFNTRTLSYYSL